MNSQRAFSSHAAAAIALRGGGRGGLGPAIVGDADWRRARAPARAAWIRRVREKGSHALRADELVLGPRWPRLSVDCCVPLLTMSEEETRASARGAFCSLAVYGTLSRPASRNADVAAFGSRCTPRAGASIFISAVLVLLLRRGRIRGASRAQAEDLAAVAKKTRQLEGPGSRTAKKLRRRRHRRLAGSRVTGAGGFARCRTTPQWRTASPPPPLRLQD